MPISYTPIVVSDTSAYTIDARETGSLFWIPDLSQDITIRMRGAAISFSDTRMRARVNGQEALLLQYNALSNSSFALASTDMDSREVGVSQEQIRVEVGFENGGNPSSRGYLDYIELIATRKLIARGRQYSFRNVNASNASLPEPNGVIQLEAELLRF